MNTVEALNALGKALLGDNYTPSVGRTDAETIYDIAKAVSENPIGGGGSSTEPRVIWLDHTEDNYMFLSAGLTWEDFVGSYICLNEKPTEEMPSTTFDADMVLSIAIPAYSDPETLQVEISDPSYGRARYNYAPADGLFWKDDN